MTARTRLELTWIGKDERPRLEPRILVEEPEHSYGRETPEGATNLLIRGDNLLALKALEQSHAGRVKCVFIDPPYNTGSAFQHYDDGVEHSLWLSLMRDRLELLWKLLTVDGSIWIAIDDREMPYLRVLCDEVFGRSSFVAQVVWQKRYSRDNNSAIGDVHDYILCYARDKESFKRSRNLLPPSDKSKTVYKNPTNDPRGPWRLIPMNGAGLRANQQYPVRTPSGKVVYPPEGRHWSVLEDKMLALIADGQVYFGKNGDGQPNLIRYLSEVEGFVPWTWWPCDEVGHNDEAKKEIHALFGKSDAFATPKPERLVQRILQIATNPGDIVLDSFAGSGTTGAVAHKMRRRWILVELGEHCETLILPRLRRVVAGKDSGGISAAEGWAGGGGFRYYRLAPSLLERDAWGNWVINKKYNGAMLAEAMCKHEGFRYDPSATVYWQQGRSTERDFIYVTTQTLAKEQLDQLSHDVGPERSLLVCCGAFRTAPDAYPNLTLKKIPNAVLGRCEWGRDDYSLNVSEEVASPDVDSSEPSKSGGSGGRKARRRPKTAAQTLPLFGGEEEAS